MALVDEAHDHGVRVRIAPSTMEILIHRADFVPGEVLPLFELRPPVFEGIDYAIKRTFDVVVATPVARRAQPAAGDDRDRREADLARSRALPLCDARRDRRAAIRRASSSERCSSCPRPDAGRALESQNEASPARSSRFATTRA